MFTSLKKEIKSSITTTKILNSHIPCQHRQPYTTHNVRWGKTTEYAYWG